MTHQERVSLRDEAMKLLQQGQLIPNGPGDQYPSSCCYVGDLSSPFALPVSFIFCNECLRLSLFSHLLFLSHWLSFSHSRMLSFSL